MNLLSTFISLLILSSQCHSQLLDNPAWFRGLLANLPFSPSDAEFLPSPRDALTRPIVTINDGALSGFVLRTVDNRVVHSFQAIPYAQPPVGNLRFSDPVKNLPWTGIRNARPRSPQCIQLDFTRTPLFFQGQEDCLYLNVYVPQRPPSENSSLPVMFFIHGGGFFLGAGSANGPRYLLDHNVILVTVNYRLGPFGFFSTEDDASPGNQGMKDQVMALRWVQENIAAFGGDPNSVTLFGQSAGAGAVSLHMISPLSRGLFHRVISESGSNLCRWSSITNTAEIARRVGRARGCPTESSHEMVECLRRIPEKLLLPLQLELAEWALVFPMPRFSPSIEHQHAGAFMTKKPAQYYLDGEAANVPYIAGFTGNELTLFMSVLMKSPLHVNDINKNWNRVGPPLMTTNRTEFTPEQLKKIWDFYMGDDKLEWDTRFKFSQLLSDNFLTYCQQEGIRYHSIYTKQPVYSYHFTYQGRYSTIQIAGARPQDWGASHNDELIYLMNNPDWYPSLSASDPELEMSRVMTSLWTNFAMQDKPLLKYGNVTLDIWQPIEPATDLYSPIRLLNLTISPQMIDDPFAKRYNFWKDEIYMDGNS